jgi:serine phosphatase RsbU (regulator of sigma subunit)
MNRGAYDFVIKPVDFLDLAQAITRGLKAIDQIKADEGELKRLQEIEKEMEMVKKIQKSLLPSYVTPFLQNNSFEVFGTLAPARIMGGDFYDFFPAGRNKLAIVIGETNSIGLSAAICISSAREAIRRFANQHLDFETCVKQINDYLFCQKTEDVSKFNLFFGIFNILTGTLEYISSGLPSPLLVSNQEISELHQSEVAIGAGLSKQHDIPVNRIGLNKRESFIIYSNGLLNLKNEKNERYLLKSLQKVILANQESPLSTLIDNIVLDTRQFLAPLTQSNDYVVLSLKFNP